MPCCGQTRAAFTPPAAAPARAPAEARAPEPDAAPAAGVADAPGTVRLRFTRAFGARVRGPVSGLEYAFSGDTAAQQVDARDADGLLRTGWFRRAY